MLSLSDNIQAYVIETFNLTPSYLDELLKGIYLSKALTCMKFLLYKQKCFLSRRPLATLLY